MGVAGGWVACALGSGVTNVAGYAPVQARLDGDGNVELRGLISTTGLVVGTTAFTLPPGMAPALKARLNVGSSSNAEFAADANPDGTVVAAGGTNWSNGAQISLDGVRFTTLP